MWIKGSVTNENHLSPTPLLIVLITFVFGSPVVITNVIFRRVEVFGREKPARRIDTMSIWAYPFTLAALAMFCWYWFVVKEALP